MINKKDVIRMRIPFPNIQAQLAIQSHMYICMQDLIPEYGFVKCQTLKPYMLNNPVFVHYVDEPADANRNPFVRTTRIDCDKLFKTVSLDFDSEMKTMIRPDICQDLYDTTNQELLIDGHIVVLLNSDELVSLNKLISKIVPADNETR